MLIYEKYVVQGTWPTQGFFAKRCCGCLLNVRAHQWGLSSADAESRQQMPVEEVETVNTNIGKLRGPERFFHSTWHTFLKKRLVRICIVSVFALVAIVGIVLTSTPVQLTKTVLVHKSSRNRIRSRRPSIYSRILT